MNNNRNEGRHIKVDAMSYVNWCLIIKNRSSCAKTYIILMRH